jgi:uncharacterized protein YcbK (DUF882 family)
MKWVYPNFTEEEIQCPCCGCLVHNADAMLRLQTLRNLMDEPIIINSAYRCTKHNIEVGGGSRSQHLYGKAFDIDVHNKSTEERMVLVNEALTAGFTGFGFYDNFLHIDTGEKRRWGAPWSTDDGLDS